MSASKVRLSANDLGVPFRPTHKDGGVRLGVVIPATTPAVSLGSVAGELERCGVESLWFADHLMSPRGAVDWLECWTSLTLIAAATTSARIGPQVLSQAFRSPGLLAKMATTLDAACVGRLELAFGAGWMETEFHTYGYILSQPGARVAQCGEVISIVRPAVAGRRVTFRGAYHTVEDLECHPSASQPGGPPITVAAAKRRMVELAVRLADNINLEPVSTGGYWGPAVERVQKACFAAGRDPMTLGVTVQITASVAETRHEAARAELGVPAFGALGLPSKIGIFGSIDDAAERLAELRSVGVDEVQCILPPGPDFVEHAAALARAAAALSA